MLARAVLATHFTLRSSNSSSHCSINIDITDSGSSSNSRRPVSSFNVDKGTRFMPFHNHYSWTQNGSNLLFTLVDCCIKLA